MDWEQRRTDEVLHTEIKRTDRHPIALQSEQDSKYGFVSETTSFITIAYQDAKKIEVLPASIIRNNTLTDNLADHFENLPAIAKKLKINLSSNTASKHRLIIHKDGLFIQQVKSKNGYFPDFTENNSTYYQISDQNLLTYYGTSSKKPDQADSVIIEGLTQLVQLLKVMNKQKIKFNFEIEQDRHFTYLAVTSDNLNYKFKILPGQGFTNFNLGYFCQMNSNTYKTIDKVA